MRRYRIELFISVGLVALVWLVFGRVAGFGFVDYDDGQYVRDMPRLHAGPTLDNIRWSLTTFYFASWHPITWMSYMLDCRWLDMDPGKMHVENVLIHGVNCVLLFWILNRATGSRWKAALVAAVFAVHPMNVEPVVWIAGRKDLLCVLFLLPALAAYTRFARTRGAMAYGLCVLFYACSLSSKSVAVTFPCLLLLWDVWPMRRMNFVGRAHRPEDHSRIFVEKLPLLVMAAGASALTSVAQHAGGAFVSFSNTPLSGRLVSVPLNYLRYLRSLFVPTDLSVFYPHQPFESPAGAFAAYVALGVICIVLWKRREKTPALLVGWLWFIGTFVPLIGFLQTGAHARADRYVYLPGIGLLILIVWGAAALLGHREGLRRLAPYVATGMVLTLGVLARSRVDAWRDTETLFARALDANPNNWFAYYKLGNVHAARRDYARAVELYAESIRIQPGYAESYNNLGNCIYFIDPARAIPYYERTVALAPNDPLGYTGLANALRATGEPARAEEVDRRLLALEPRDEAARRGPGAPGQ